MFIFFKNQRQRVTRAVGGHDGNGTEINRPLPSSHRREREASIQNLEQDTFTIGAGGTALKLYSLLVRPMRINLEWDKIIHFAVLIIYPQSDISSHRSLSVLNGKSLVILKKLILQPFCAVKASISIYTLLQLHSLGSHIFGSVQGRKPAGKP